MNTSAIATVIGSALLSILKKSGGRSTKFAMGEEKIINVYHEFDLSAEAIDFFSANPDVIDKIPKEIYKDLLTHPHLDLSFIDVDIEYEEVDPDEYLCRFIITFSAKIIIPPGEEEEDGEEEYLTNLMYKIMSDFPFYSHFDYDYENDMRDDIYIRKIPFVLNENGEWEPYEPLLNKPSKLRRR